MRLHDLGDSSPDRHAELWPAVSRRGGDGLASAGSVSRPYGCGLRKIWTMSLGQFLKWHVLL